MWVRVEEWRSDDNSPSTMRRSVSSSGCFTEALPHRSPCAEQEHADEIRGKPQGQSDLLVAHVGVVAERDREARALVELGENAPEGIAAPDGRDRPPGGGGLGA